MGRTTIGMVAVVAAATLGLAACGGNSGDAHTAAGGSAEAASSAAGGAVESSETAAPAGPRKNVPVSSLVLSAADLPPGFTEIPLSSDQLQKALDALGGASGDLAITPAGCGDATQVSSAIKKMRASDMAMLAARGGTGLLSDAVVATPPAVAKIRGNLTGSCSTMSAKGTTMGVAVETTTSFSKIDVPKGAASDVFAVQEITKSVVRGSTTTQSAFEAWADVNGYAVAVKLTALTGGPDRAAFDSAVAKAIAKAAAGS
ncbi:hypothetical protein P0W64_15910 [Tsukamurella sp. 8F]|uniref:hypothetical protein n=1 Tax=unclassified Tsukamurella TaxID=2633480 RepID=UPI0023B9D299|nr:MULTISPECIES: hypothetical protein [unclassified Tsukamurella]MDF0530940.1 hypothetical protein [Tsukamurella sp. 8J]MDF0588265.1 hypothetical protein [Tsukamurella sp. 8F]